MTHDKSWFEFEDKKKPRLATASWVPLYSNQVWQEKQFGDIDYWEEYFGAAAILMPQDVENPFTSVQWSNAFRFRQGSWIDGDEYVEARYYFEGENVGEYLVFRNNFETPDQEQLLIEPDLILAFHLLQEGDAWVNPEEDYVEVIRQIRDATGKVVQVEMRSEYLKDYLCARKSGLLVATFRSRDRIFADEPDFKLVEKLVQGWRDVGSKRDESQPKWRRARAKTQYFDYWSYRC